MQASILPTNTPSITPTQSPNNRPTEYKSYHRLSLLNSNDQILYLSTLICNWTNNIRYY